MVDSIMDSNHQPLKSISMILCVKNTKQPKNIYESTNIYSEVPNTYVLN